MHATPEGSWPEGFAERLARALGPQEAARALAAQAAPARVAFRASGLRATPEAALAAVRTDGLEPEPVAGLEGVWTAPAADRGRLTHGRAAAEGLIYVQNPSSVAAVEALDPRPGEAVLDLCAAPGGKTLLLAERVGERGEVSAVEAVRARFHRMRANLARHGAAGRVRCFLADGTRVWRRVEGRFDRVLVDAPCSAEARIRPGDPATSRHWSPRKVAEMARKQRRLLEAGLRSLRPGGVLVYCTCTYAPEENEAVLSWLLARHPGLEVEAVRVPAPRTRPGLAAWDGDTFPEAVTRAVRILPDGLWEGFFLCRLRRP